MSKKFEIQLSACGTVYEIKEAIKSLLIHIHETPTPATRIDARHTTHTLRQTYLQANELGLKEQGEKMGLWFDYCERCKIVTPTVRTYKACKCVLCGVDREQDITHAYEGTNINYTITEIDNETPD